MSPATHGMNVEEVRRLGQTMQQKSEDIRALLRIADDLISQAKWVGPDQQAFLTNTWPECQAKMTAVVRALQEGGQTALRNAQEQQHASHG